MITRTSELAIQALLALELEGGGEPLSPRQLATRLECSPSYLAKTLGMLVRAGLLRSFRGAKGGVVPARPAQEVLLLHVVEACQGLLVGNYCRALEAPVEGAENNAGAPAGVSVCGFHRAMADVHRSTVEALSRWSLADLAANPVPDRPDADGMPCKMRLAGGDRHR